MPGTRASSFDAGHVAVDRVLHAVARQDDLLVDAALLGLRAAPRHEARLALAPRLASRRPAGAAVEERALLLGHVLAGADATARASSSTKRPRGRRRASPTPRMRAISAAVAGPGARDRDQRLAGRDPVRGHVAALRLALAQLGDARRTARSRSDSLSTPLMRSVGRRVLRVRAPRRAEARR